MTPALTICSYPDCWEISTHLQVGRKTFRYYTFEFKIIAEVAAFLEGWKENWQALALDAWDYHGLEDIVEPDLDKSSLSANVSMALANLLPQQPVYRRKL